MAFLAIVVLLGLRTRRPVAAAVVTVASIAIALVALQALGPSLSADASSSGSDLVSHQVGGITNPLNPRESTLLTHVGLVGSGLHEGLTHPLGQGTAATNLAAGRFGSNASQPTEVDISNQFVGLGLVGGLAYLVVVILVLVRAVRGYFAGQDLLLPVLGLLIVGAGQWLTGGHYALSRRSRGCSSAGSLPATRRSSHVPASRRLRDRRPVER